MKWIRKNATKWWLWVIVTILFLIVVQILFRIEAPCKWLDAVWEAGDFISLIGTLVLGYIAILQAKQANDVANDANETSRKVIELQEAEYTPIVTIEEFVGITNHIVHKVNKNTESEMIVHKMNCIDGNIIVGYSISLLEPNCTITNSTHCRDYEIHLKYSGRFAVESFLIKEIRFIGNNFEKSFKIKKSEEMSLSFDQEFPLFLFLFSDEDFLNENNSSHKYITSSNIVFEIEMKSITGKIYNETIKVRKLLVDNTGTKLNLRNAEMLVSASYHVKNN